MRYLRYATTTYQLVGPIVDVVSGTSMTTNMVAASADSAFLSKHDSTVSTTMQELTAWSSIEAGFYLYGFTTAETDTVGPLDMNIIDESLSLPTRHEFHVLSQPVYDGMFGSSDSTSLAPVNTQQINKTETTGTGQSADKWRG